MKIVLNILVFIVLLTSKVLSQSITLADTNLRNCLVKTYPQAFDNSKNLITSEANTITSVNCPSYKISNLDDLIHFQKLSVLVIPKNNYKKFPKFYTDSIVTFINVTESNIDSLPDLSSFINLSYLSIQKNNITKFPDLSKNTKLTSLIVKSNPFTSIPQINLPNLEYLDISNLNLSRLPDISLLKNLKQLDCYSNKLTAFPDFSVYDSLTMIDASTNQISTFPSLPSSIRKVYLDNNQLYTLPDLSNYSNLTEVRLYNNNLTFEDLVPLTQNQNFQSVYKLIPQNVVRIAQTKSIVENQKVCLAANIDLSLPDVSVQWFQNSTFCYNTNSFCIDTFKLKNAGKYSVKFTHPLISGLTLVSDTFYLNYTPCVIDTNIEKTITDASCLSKGEVKINLGIQPQTNYQIYLTSLLSGKTIKNINNVFSQLTEPKYLLTIVGDRNCLHIVDTVAIKTLECDQIVITPNGDGVDEEFYFSKTGNAEIIDKWGNKQGTLALPAIWDGKINGKLLPVGFYILNINNGKDLYKISIIY